MRLSRIIRFAAYALLAASIPAHADPITSAIAAISAWVSTLSTATLITIGLTALELGASFIGLSMLKKPSSGAGINGEEQEGGLVPQAFPFGNAATGGSIVYRNVWGKAGKIPNAYYTKVIALSDIPLPSNALKYVWVDDKKCTFGSGTPDSDMGYALPEMATDGGHDHAWVKFYDGTQTAADPWLVSLFGSDPDRPYGSDRVGYGRAYVIITFLNTKHFDLYRGWPKTLFEVDGAKLYDVRKDTSEGGSGTHRLDDPTTWETTENPQVVRYHLRRGITYASRHFFGLQNMVAARVPYDNWVAAMNECDTTVTTAAGGTEPQFRCGGEISVGTEMASIDESLMLACNARSIEIGGIYKTTTGAIGSSILSFTDADLLIDQPQTLDQYPGVGSIVNGVTAHYPEPAEQWQRKDAPPLYNSTYEAEDGGRFSADLKFDAVPFGEQVQRQMKSNLEENRRWRTHNVVFPHTAAKIEPGDAADWSSGRNGYSAKIFRIESIKRLRNRNVAAVLREADPSDYTFVPSTDYTAPTLGTITRYDIPNLAMSGWTVSAVTISGDNGAALPGIRLAWDTDDLDGVVGVSAQIRLKTNGDVVNDVPLVRNWESGSVDIGANLLPNTVYQARGRYVAATGSRMDTDWSDWLDVTTDDVRISSSQVDSSIALQSALDAEAAARAAADTVEQDAREILAAAKEYSDGALRRLSDDLSKFSNGLVNLQVLHQSAAAKSNTAIAIAREELTSQFTDGLSAQAERVLELSAFVQGLVGADDALALAAQVYENQTAIADLATGKAEASDLSVLSSQINTPITGLAAVVAYNSSAISALDPDSASATLNTSVLAIRELGHNVDIYGQTIAGILAQIANKEKRSNASLAYYRSEITSQVVEGQSANARAIGEVGVLLQTEKATLQASIVAEQVARADAVSAEATTRNSQIASINTALDGKASTAAVSAAIASESSARVSADNALTTQINTYGSYFGSGIDGSNTVAAKIATEASTRSSADAALSSSVSVLQSSLGSYNDGSGGVATAINNTIAKVNLRNAVFYQTSAPTAYNVGDLWFDSDDSNKQYRWNGSNWISVQDGSKVRTFAQTISPTATAVGDLWIDTDDSNKLYRWNGSSWSLIRDAQITTNTSLISSLSTTVSGHTATLTTYGSSIDGLNARYGISINVDGHVTGLVQLDGSTSESNFTVIADNFRIWNGVDTAEPVFSVSGGVVSMENAFIKNLTASNLSVGSANRFGKDYYASGTGIQLGSTPQIILNSEMTLGDGSSFLVGFIILVQSNTSSSKDFTIEITPPTGVSDTSQLSYFSWKKTYTHPGSGSGNLVVSESLTDYPLSSNLNQKISISASGNDSLHVVLASMVIQQPVR